MGYLGATLTQVFTRAGGADVSLRDVTIARDWKRGYRVRMMSRTGSARRILGILKKSISWVEFCLRRRRLAFACSSKPGQWPLWRVPHMLGVGGRWKSQNRKNVYLSPYVEEPLNSKVIKSFVPELRIVSVFRVSSFLCSMLYIYDYDVHFTYPYDGYGTISLVCRLKSPHSCFSSHFCFLVIFFCWSSQCLCFIIIYSLEFFKSALADGLSLEFE